MNFKILFLVFFGFANCFGLVVEEGNSAEIFCDKFSENFSFINWSVLSFNSSTRLDLLYINENSSKIFTNQTKYEISIKNESGIIVSNLQLIDDKSEFICDVITPLTSYQSRTTLDVVALARSPVALRVSMTSQPVIKKIGACTSGYAFPKPQITFYRNGVEIVEKKPIEFVVFDDDNIKVSVTKVLMMQVMTSYHNSNFTCRVTSGRDDVTIDRELSLGILRVIYPVTEVKVIAEGGNRDFYRAGDVITFRCIYDGFPSAEILSFGPDYSTSDSIEVFMTSQLDGGDVTCTVASSNDYPVSSSIPISVRYLENVRIVGDDVITLNTSLKLLCEADSKPEAVFWWLKDGDVISSGAELLLRATDDVIASGAYQCVASNSELEVSTPVKQIRTVTSSVVHSTVSPITSSLSRQVGNDVTFNLNSVTSSFDELIWYKLVAMQRKILFTVNLQEPIKIFQIDNKFHLHDNFSISITNLLLEDSGVYGCDVITNSATSTQQFDLQVEGIIGNWNEPEELIEENNLTCQVQSSKVPRFDWTREDGLLGSRRIDEKTTLKISSFSEEFIFSQTLFYQDLDEDFFLGAVLRCSVSISDEEKVEKKFFLKPKISMRSSTTSSPMTSPTSRSQQTSETMTIVSNTANVDVMTSINDDVTTSINDDVTTSINDDVTTSINDDITTLINDDVTTSINGDVTASINDDVTTSINDDVTTSINDDVTTSINDDVIASINDDVTTSINDDITTLINDDVTTSINGDVTTATDDDITTLISDDVTTSLNHDVATLINDDVINTSSLNVFTQTQTSTSSPMMSQTSNYQKISEAMATTDVTTSMINRVPVTTSLNEMMTSSLESMKSSLESMTSSLESMTSSLESMTSSNFRDESSSSTTSISTTIPMTSPKTLAKKSSVQKSCQIPNVTSSNLVANNWIIRDDVKNPIFILGIRKKRKMRIGKVSYRKSGLYTMMVKSNIRGLKIEKAKFFRYHLVEKGNCESRLDDVTCSVVNQIEAKRRRRRRGSKRLKSKMRAFAPFSSCTLVIQAVIYGSDGKIYVDHVTDLSNIGDYNLSIFMRPRHKTTS